jgi:hypothetical protein
MQVERGIKLNWVDDTRVGVNPKINNLMSSFSSASYDILWVLDATIAIQPGALGRMVDAFLDSPTHQLAFDHDLESTPLMSDDIRRPPTSGQVGLVHHVPVAVVHQKTWGSLIEQAFLNTTHAKMYLAIVSPAQLPFSCDPADLAECDSYRIMRHGQIQHVLSRQHRIPHIPVTDVTTFA